MTGNTTGISILAIHDNANLTASFDACRGNKIDVTEVASLSEGMNLVKHHAQYQLVLIGMRIARFQSRSTSCIGCAMGHRKRLIFLDDTEHDDDVGFSHIRRSHCVIASPHLDGWKSIIGMIFRGIELSPVEQPQSWSDFSTENSSSMSLTPRQQQVLNLICRGLSNRDIASKLNLTEGTVKLHNTGIFKSLGVKNRTEAALHGARHLQKLLPPQNVQAQHQG